jgi:hypothetical protein
MKTFQQFWEDAASDYERGMKAYQSSPEQRLNARRQSAAELSRTSAEAFKNRMIQRQQETRDRIRQRQEMQRLKNEIKGELQTSQD